jgi:hypothetical protein
MCCPHCTSAKTLELPADLAVHFRGYANLSRSHVFMSVKVLVCLDCGFSRFTTPETNLQALREGTASSEAG